MSTPGEYFVIILLFSIPLVAYVGGYFITCQNLLSDSDRDPDDGAVAEEYVRQIGSVRSTTLENAPLQISHQ